MTSTFFNNFIAFVAIIGLFFVSGCNQSPEEQYNRGLSYVEGDAVLVDYVKAVEWYRKAAERGYAPAQYSLACCLLHGDVVIQNDIDPIKLLHDIDPIKLLRQAAEKKHAMAMFELGRCYEYGHGVSEDIDEMVKWYRKAADLGIAEAQFEIAICYLEGGKGLSEDEEEGIKWLHKAADQGFEQAKEALKRADSLKARRLFLEGLRD